MLKWMQSKEAEQISEVAKEKAWKDFKIKYPFADISKLTAQTDFIDKKHATADINFKAGPDFLQSVSGSDRRYWSVEMKKALGIGGFPVELTLNSHPSNPVPAVQFDGNPEAFGSLLNQKIKLFISPTEYFTTKFRAIFTQTKITHTSGAESNKWLSGPNMIYWSQQLNFAFWCASTCSGISRDLINTIPEQVKSFLLFHIYFTTTRILFEMGGI